MEPVLTERPSDRHRNEILLSDELDSVDDRTLRLKGILSPSIVPYPSISSGLAKPDRSFLRLGISVVLFR